MNLAMRFVLGVVAIMNVSSSIANDGSMKTLNPVRVGGYSATGDARDGDIFPSAAYDPITGRVLVVWMSLRHAGSSSDGFSVYGQFVSSLGNPLGSEFLISNANSAARNSSPTVVAGNGIFVVAWGARGAPCRVMAQRVTDAANHADIVLSSGVSHRHSPDLTFDASTGRFVAVYVDGEDYSPPSIFGAVTNDCGNNSNSVSRIRATQFHFVGETLVVDALQGVSDVTGGAFRPKIAFANDQYVAVWEDRRDGLSQPDRFDIYAQPMTNALIPIGADLSLSTGISYTNDNANTPWTPRPTISSGESEFRAAWFERTASPPGATWVVKSTRLPINGAPEQPTIVMQMTFAMTHASNPPSGFLRLTYAAYAQEYALAVTGHLETIFGYLSSIRCQRIGKSGDLLDRNGALMSHPSVGVAMDYVNDDQISVGATMIPVHGPQVSGALMVYGRHALSRHSQDFDIWSAVAQLPAPNIKSIFLPIARKS
jgi:hypothetical protein